MTNYKTIKDYYRVRTSLKEIFGFAEHQDNCTYGLGYKLKLQRKNDNHVLCHLSQANDAAKLALTARVVIIDISLQIPHFTPSVSNKKLI